MNSSPKPLEIDGFASVHLTVTEPLVATKDYEALFGHAAGGQANEPAFALDNTTVHLKGSPGSRSDVPRGAPARESGISGFGLHSRDQRVVNVDSSPRALNARSLDDLLVADADATSNPTDRDATPADPALVQAIDHLVIRSLDVTATRQLYEEALGLRVLFDREFEDWNVRLCMCRVGDAVLEIAGALGEPRSEMSLGQNRDRLWGITWRVSSAIAAHDRLVKEGVDVSDVRAGRRPRTRVLSVRSHCHGVATLLIEHQATRG